MQIQNPVYETLMTVDLNEENENLDIMVEPGMSRVKRRPFGNNLRSRLNQIVSMYIPSNNSPDRKFDQINESTDHTGLLNAAEARIEYSITKHDELYKIHLLYKREELIKVMLDTVNITGNSSRYKLTTIAADQQTIYVSLSELPYVFLLASNCRVGGTTESDQIVKSFIHLRSAGVGEIIPKEVCVGSLKSGVSVLYVVGVVDVKSTNSSETQEQKWILAKFALNGKQLARSRVYSYQRYSGLSVDTNDGQLLLACPMIKEISGTKFSTEMAGQVCKLTPGFERRIFSITMGKENAIYRPNFVTQECAGHCCWASVERWPQNDADQENMNNESQTIPNRRLLAFPGRQPLNQSVKQSAREWLHTFSWDFADLSPGRITAFDSDRLLVIDTETGALSYITWPNGQDTPCLSRITRPSNQSITLLCSTFNALQFDEEKNNHSKENNHAQNYKNCAYFVSDSNIYSFEFRR